MPGHLDWGAKTLSLTNLAKRAQFPLYVERQPSNFALRQCQIVWVENVADRPYQAVWLHYVASSGQSIDLVEAPVRNIGGQKATPQSIMIIANLGYFPIHLKDPYVISPGRRGRTDFGVYYEKSDEALGESFEKGLVPLVGRNEKLAKRALNGGCR